MSTNFEQEADTFASLFKMDLVIVAGHIRTYSDPIYGVGMTITMDREGDHKVELMGGTVEPDIQLRTSRMSIKDKNIVHKLFHIQAMVSWHALHRDKINEELLCG